MRILFRRWILFGSTILSLGLVFDRFAVADGPAGREMFPSVVEFSAGFAPAGGIFWRTWLEGAQSGGDGAVQVVGAMTLELGRIRGLKVITNYPDLRVGDIMPALGSLYRVDGITDLGQPKGTKGKDRMTVSHAEPKTLPSGLSFQQRSVAIPLDHDGRGGTIFNSYAVVTQITAKLEHAGKTDNRDAIATLNILESGPAPAGSPHGTSVSKTTKVKVRRGDTVTIDKHPMKVRNIVPRDPKQHVIGWVELDPGTVASK